ncbi:DUF3867 family protein [Oceanirhabdus seepicola]|uniref:DUF3867 family protein n=1 Tax=Oceanirhabdus seepicola TaxID=2828781 RepID=A0A9J6NY24_9CLOT|nr:DUF3867 family protein [Oceanirhabdus seepicola]MCM1988533.1 DUF3867 family protein [Oceanirhabdus seepicola]
MSDIIDINQLRNKVSEKDVNEFREFIFGLYDKLAEGKLFVGDITEQMDKYADEKRIGEEKLCNLRQELINELTEEVGINIDEIEKQIDGDNINLDLGECSKQLNLSDKNINNISIRGVLKHRINNQVNDLIVILEENKGYILTEGKLDYDDKELKNIIENYKKNHNKREIEVIVLKEIDRFTY